VSSSLPPSLTLPPSLSPSFLPPQAEKVTTVVGGEAPTASGVMIVSESIQVGREGGREGGRERGG
jgi:hypothetical protein